MIYTLNTHVGEPMENVTDSLKTEFICFNLDGQEFGVQIHFVREILQAPHITRVVHAPACVAGVFNIRGVITAVLNIKNLLHLGNQTIAENSKIILLQFNEKTAGILVDTVEMVKEVTLAQIFQLENNNHSDENYYDGVVQYEDRPLTIVSVNKLFSSSELSVLQNASSR